MKSKVRIFSLILVVLVSVLSITAWGCSAPADESYKITEATTNKHGTLVWTVNGAIAMDIAKGSTVDFVVYPDLGYVVESVSVNGQDVTATVSNNRFSVTNVSSDLSVSVGYAVQGHTVTTNTPSGGTVVVGGSNAHGGTATITVTPNAGYEIKTLLVNNQDVLASLEDGVYSFVLNADAIVYCEFTAKSFEYLDNAPANGKVEISDDELVYGEEVTLTVTPDSHYEVDSVKVNGQAITLVDGKYTFTVRGNVAVECAFKKIVYSITSLPAENGEVEISATTATYGEEITITVTPDANYKIKSVKINGTAVMLTDGAYTFAVEGNTEIVCEFEKTVYTITAATVENGEVEISATTAIHGEEVTLTVTPDSHYEVDSVKVNGQAITLVDGKYTFTVSGNVAVECSFKKIVYSITSLAAENGKVEISANTATYGEEITITVTPDAHYEVKSVKVNGTEVELSAGAYTFAVEGNTEIVCEFAHDVYSIAVMPAENGKVELSATTATYGEEITVTVTPNVHYEVKSVKVNGTEVELSAGAYTFAVEGNTEIVCEFEKTVYTITAATVENGKVELSATTATYGEEITVTVTPNAHYEVKSVKVNGTEVELSAGVYTFAVEGNTEIVCEFAKTVYAITVKTAENGSAVANKENAVYQDVVSVTFTPDEGYALESATVNGRDVLSEVENGVYEFVVSQDVTIEYSYARLRYTVSHNTSIYGTIEVDNENPYYGETVTVTVTPIADYKVSLVTVNGKTAEIADGKVVITDVSENVAINVTFEMITVKYYGYVRDGNGNFLSGATVSCGTSTITTEANGYFRFDLKKGTYTFTARKADYYDSDSVTKTATSLNGIGVGTLTLYEKTLGYNYSETVTSTGNDYATISYDKTTQSEKIVTNMLNNEPIYIKGMDVTYGVIYFSVTNLTDLSRPGAELDSGVGLFIQRKGTEDNVAPQFSLASSRFVLNRWQGGAEFGTGGNEAIYNIGVPHVKYYFAFVKSGRTMSLYARNKAGAYVLIQSYTNSLFGNACYIGFSASANPNTATHCTIEFNDISCYPNTSDINVGLEKYAVTANPTENGQIRIDKTQATTSDVVQIEFVPNDGYVLYSASVNGNPIEVVNNKLELKEIVENTTVSAVFVEAKNIELAYNGDGTISYALHELYLGNTLQMRATPSEGKRLTALSVNGKAVEYEYTVFGDYVFDVTVDTFSIEINATYVDGEETTVAYSTGSVGGSHNYDASLFYRNDKDVEGADPGAIYVSLEDDPVYGGWFYMATTGCEYGKLDGWAPYGAFPMFKSKNLVDWIPCGAVNNGYALYVDKNQTWSRDSYWAPELLQETIEVDGVKKNRYYIYFSANNKRSDGSSTQWNGLHIGVAVSDCPYGPYRMVDTTTYYQFYGENTTVNKNGDMILANQPTFDFYKYNPELQQAYTNSGISANFWPAIDISPFIDPATKEMYCYFSQHVSSVSNGNRIWVVKMKDYITPDYTTMHVVAIPGYNVNTTDYKPYVGNESLDYSKTTTFSYDAAGKINEGGFVIANYDEANERWLYYLTYSPFGYYSRTYSVVQAISTSPYGPFKKIDPSKGYTIIGIKSNTPLMPNDGPNYNMPYDMSQSIDYAACSGHHSFVKAGNEIFAVYHTYYNSIDNFNGVGAVDKDKFMIERRIAVDRVKFVTSPYLRLGDVSGTSGDYIPVLYGNGPAYSYQPLPEVSSSYHNVASEAKITTANSSTRGTEYLTDGLFVMHNEYRDWEFETYTNVLTFEFEKAKNVRAIMVYNSAQYAYALKSVRSITLTLDDDSTVTFENVTQDEDNYYTEKAVMRYGSSIIADFEEMAVKKIEITVNSQDKLDTSNSIIRIGDVVILARAEGKEKTGFDFSSVGDSSSMEYVVDGIANDKAWLDKKWFEYDNGEYSLTATADLGQDGIFITATVFDKYMFHAGNYGEGEKLEGLNRWYKNTWLKAYVYAGDTSSYNSSLLKDVTVSAYSVISSTGVSADMSVDGVINSGNSRSFTIEAYVPYSAFGISSATEAYLAFDYQRPLSATELKPNVDVIGDIDINNIKELIKVDNDGFVSGGIAIKKLVGGKVNINGKELKSSTNYILNDYGTEITTMDVTPLGDIWFSDITSNCAVIEYTTECFLDPSTLTYGTYDTDACIGIIYTNGDNSSSVAFHGNKARVQTDMNKWIFNQTVYDPSVTLPQGISNYGVTQKFVGVYLNNVWYMFYERNGSYVLAYTTQSYQMKATGTCAFGFVVGSAQQYTRIKIKDISINVNRTYVSSKLTELRGY